MGREKASSSLDRMPIGLKKKSGKLFDGKFLLMDFSRNAAS
jgi:hypothetical protein